MDASKSTEAAATKCFENDGKEFYEVPAHLVEWKEKPNGRRVLIVKNANATHYRKYKPGNNATTFYCWSCYINYGLRVEATYLNGIVKAPLRHACELIPITNQKKNEKIKLETNDKINGNPSSSTSFPFTSSTSASKSNVLVSENPCKNISSNPAADDDPDRPLSRESDVIFIDNDEIKPDYKDSSTTFTEKLQAFKRGTDYRTIAPSEYEEAFSAGGYKGNRIIVFEENDQSRVKQYAGNNNNYWYCLGCFRGKEKHTQAFQEKDKTFLVPKKHFCTPMLYDEAKKEQQKIVKRLKINEEDGSTGDENVNDEESDASPSPPPEVNSIRSRLRSRSPAAQVFTPSSSIKGREKPLQVKKRPERKRKASPPIVSTHKKRAVIEGGYLSGVGAQNQANGRIIVFLDDDKTQVHEYRRSKENSYYCRGCFAMNKSKKRFAIMGNNKIFRVPFLGEHVCQPLPYADIQEEQKSIKEKYAPKKVATVKQSKSANQISTSATSSSRTALLQPAPILSRPRLRTKTRTPVNSPASDVSTSYKLPINQRERTPYPSSILHQRRLKRKAERQNDADSEATKKSKPIEGELESQDSDKIIEKPKENSAKNLKYSRIVKDNTFKRNILNAANATDRNGSHTMENSSTASTPANRPPLVRQNVLNPTTCVPKPSNTSLIKSFTTISSTTLPPISTSATPETIPPPPTPPSTVPTPSSILASSKIILTIPSLPNLLSAIPTPSATSTPLPSSTSTVKFYKPSQYFLEKCCKKLGMDYTDQVYKFWFNISIHQVSPSSIPDKLYPTVESKYHGFECLSLFIIGSEDKAADIREKINEHMYYENTRSSTAINRQIEGVALFSSVITGPHLALIAAWLDCRIGIFAEGEWKRYGNWDATDADIPILLMELKNGKYSPILTLK